MGFLKKKRERKAVAYYRRSTRDMQEYSIPIQREEARNFAAKHGIEIIHEEEDKDSGVTAERPGFRRLMNDWVQNQDSAAFDYILVKDDSRWGRFQKQDEAGHYEYLCNENGIQVIYFSEGFPPEGDGFEMLTGLQRTVKREMASEFSRKLSRDVFRGMVEISSEGYSVGGTACYGMNRLLLDEKKQPIKILKKGEHKGLANDRVRFVPADDQTTKAVRDIFTWFVDELKGMEEIADTLNAQKVPAPNGKEWNKNKVLRILTNETYVGTRLYNKTSNKLKKGHHKNPRSEWVICPNAFPALIERKYFAISQERIYWLLPSRHRKGFYLLNKTRRNIKHDIRSVLEGAGADPEDARTFPLSLAIKRQTADPAPYWCFLIPEDMESNRAILCVSVEMTTDDPIERMFLIPTQAFDIRGMCVLSDRDERCLKWAIKETEIESVVLSLHQNTRN